ncbi:MAG: rhodanese-like domain-containing protein [Pirellulaceae bacterium]
MTVPLEITASDVKQKIDDGADFILLDVREPFEFEYCKIAGSYHVPMGEIPQRVDQWASWKDEPIVVVCHHGVRSLQVTHFLRSKGFGHSQSLRDGIEGWSLTIDPNIPRY